MKYIIIILTFFLFAGCGKDKKNNDDERREATGESRTDKTDSAKISQDAVTKDEQIEDAMSKSGQDFGFKNAEYDIKDLSGFKYTGNVVASARWTDKNGQNFLIITETEEKRTKKGTQDEAVSKELFGYQYAEDVNGDMKQLWKINDFVKNCNFDLTLEYFKNSLTITDIDNDGIAESTFLYRMACRSDVSPADMKLIMHENDNKYAIRGTQYIKLPNEGPSGGEIKVDPEFNKAPKEFLDHAKKEWEKYKEEKFN